MATALAVEGCRLLIAHVEQTGSISWISQEACDALGYRSRTIRRSGLSLFAVEARADSCRNEAIIAAAHATGGLSFSGHHEFADGRVCEAHVRMVPQGLGAQARWDYGRSAPPISSRCRAMNPLKLAIAAVAELGGDLRDWERYRRDHHYAKDDVTRGPNTIREAMRLVGWESQLDITRASVVDYLAILATSSKEKTRRNKLALLGAFLEWSSNTGRREDRPDKGLRVAPRGGRRRSRPIGQASFSWDEVRRLVAAASKSESNPRRWDTPRSLIYLVAATTGLRKGEIGRLRWKWIHDLDGKHPMIILPDSEDAGEETSKSRSEQEFPLAPETAARLLDFRPREPLGRVFPRVPDHSTITSDMERAGVPRLDDRGRKRTFKSLRSTFNTELAMKGVRLEQRQAMMRHTDPKLTATTYLDRDRLDLSTAIKSLDTIGLRESTPGDIHNGDEPLDTAAEIAQDESTDKDAMIATRTQLERTLGFASARTSHPCPEPGSPGANPIAPSGCGADRGTPTDLSQVTPRGFEPRPVTPPGRPCEASGQYSQPESGTQTRGQSENSLIAELLELDARRYAILAQLIRGGGS